MAKGDGCHRSHPTGLSSFSREWEELFCKLTANVLAVGSLLGISVHEKKFQIGPTVLALKLDKERVLRGMATTPMDFLTYFSNHEDDIQS